MKAAVSIEDGTGPSAPICPGFGRAPWFLIVDLDTGESTAVANDAAAGAHGAGTGAVALLRNHGVDAIVSGRYGPNAVQALDAAGIRRFVSDGDATAGAALERLRRGTLEEDSPA